MFNHTCVAFAIRAPRIDRNRLLLISEDLVDGLTLLEDRHLDIVIDTCELQLRVNINDRVRISPQGCPLSRNDCSEKDLLLSLGRKHSCLAVSNDCLAQSVTCRDNRIFHRLRHNRRNLVTKFVQNVSPHTGADILHQLLI